MLLGKITGNVVSTIKNENFFGQKLLTCESINLNFETLGDEIIVFDAVGAGIGDIVLICQEGGSVNKILGLSKAPVDFAVVAIVDNVSVDE